jgi:phospholipid/cholesterol/gamma-HCH transport system permease protein
MAALESTPVARLGLASLEFVEELGRMARFTGSVLRRTLSPPWRLRRSVDEVYDTGVLSLLIIVLSGVTVGAVLGLQGYHTLTTFGAEAQLGAVVGQVLIRELGPVLTALLVTGRAGSAMAAEIAAMVQTDQLDGLRMMSIDPIDYVVSPKALAMLFVMPLLTGIFIACAIYGGYLVGVELLGVDGGTYISSLESSIDFENHVAQSLVKSLVFGALVGLIATFRGYTAEPTAAGVSRATTSTVVIGSVSILVSDYIVTALWGVQ